MRSPKFIPAALAAISLLVLLPAGAFARKHSSANGKCSINMTVAPRQIVAGEPIVIFGQLRCTNPARAAGKEVVLYRHLDGVGGFSIVQTVTTDASGFYSIAPADGVVETNRSYYVRSTGARGATKHLLVAAQVTLSGPPEGQLLTGFANRVTFTGTVSPADAGAIVILQRQNASIGNEWHRIDRGVVDASGNFTIVHRFIVPGDANIRVLVRSQRRNVPSTSNVLAYSISQAQNPALTIQASADPIAFGESVTISGKYPAGPNQPVTLLARGRHQHGFARIAQVSANGAGEYTFPAQTPVNSTFYEVKGSQTICFAGSHHPKAGCRLAPSSAVLYEGVKDVLGAQVSATTVQAGQTVTFSGTVSPDHTNHVIYLERQNAHGSDFHVVQVAFVGGGSVYSIVHRFYDPGLKVVRVFIPGGPENEGAASAPFTITVTPAPALSLTPEAPENSTVPQEGQS